MLRLQNQLLCLLRSGSNSPIPASTLTPLHLLLLSTSTSASPAPFSVEDYLVTTCGLTRAQALKASKKVRSPSKTEAVLSFLAGLGLSPPDIAAVVVADPLFLRADVEKILANRVAALRGLGLSTPDIARFVLIGSTALRSCGDIVSKLEFWLPFFGSFDEFLQAMRKCSSILKHDIDKVVKPNVSHLLQCGLNARDVAKLHFRGRWMLFCKPEKLDEFVMRAEKLGVPCSSAMFKYALATVYWISQEKLASRIEVLKSALGCSEDQLRIAVAKHPIALTVSDDNLRSTVEFLIIEVGLGPEYIVHRPALLSYSLKGRLVPRFFVMKALQEKGLPRADYFSLVAASEKKFMSRYIDCYKDSVPGLADVYAAARAGEMPSRIRL